MKLTAVTTAADATAAQIDADEQTSLAAETKAEAALTYRQVEVAKRPPPPPAPTADELALIEKNKETGRLLLQKFEENARTTMNKYMKQLSTDTDNEITKQRYYKARSIYLEVAKSTGADSPAKAAERAVIAKAQDAKKKSDVATAFAAMESVEEVEAALEKAEVPAAVRNTIQQAKDSAEFAAVLEETRTNPAVAAELA